MKLRHKAALPLLAALAIAMIPFSVAAEEAILVPQLNVSGNAELRVEPDLAVVTLGVTHDAKRADVAQAEVNRVASQILAAVEELGIESGDIQTSRLTINPVYEHDPERKRAVVTGFRATNTVSIRVTDLDLVGPVVDASVEVGGNELQGVSFQLEDDDAATLEALRLAVADARAKAEAMASALGTPLGRVLTASDSGARVRPIFQEARSYRAVADAAPPTPVAAGKVGIEANVSLVYELVSSK